MTAIHPPGTHPSADDPRVLLDDDYVNYEPIPPYPPRTEREAEFYTLGDGEMFINLGPQHPSTHGVLRVVLKLDGERVVDIDPVLGYLHRGVEKLCENADYHQTISQLDPLEYVSSLFCEWGPVMAYEKLLDVQVPRRADFMSRLGDWMSRAVEQIDSNTQLLNENEIFVRRASGLGVMDTETALRFCMTGPNLRATGLPFDLRRAHPYSIYPELDFDVPTRTEGDSLARYLLRMEEVKQSLRIIDQCLEQMPDGPVMAKLPRLIRPRPGRAWSG